MRDRDKTGKPHPLFASVRGGRANQPPDPPRREPTSAEKYSYARAGAHGRLAMESLVSEIERTKRPPVPPVDEIKRHSRVRPSANENTPRPNHKLSAHDLELLGQIISGPHPAAPSGKPQDILTEIRNGREPATRTFAARTRHCRDCVFAKVGWWERLGYGYRYATCGHAMARYYVWSADTHYIVTGEPAPDDSKQDSCYSQRGEEGACGPNGRFFTPKKRYKRKLKRELKILEKAEKIAAKRLGELE